MPLKLFHDLDQEKKERILAAARNEFAHYGYNESSTNNIVKNAGIGKGSLFKYFANKEDLYYYLLDCAIESLSVELSHGLSSLPRDLADRLVRYSELEFFWHIQNPIQYKLFKRAFTDDNSISYKKTIERYGAAGDALFEKILEDVDAECLRYSKEKVLNVLQWFLKGFNEDFIKKVKEEENIDRVKDLYMKQLKDYIRILKEGLYK